MVVNSLVSFFNEFCALFFPSLCFGCSKLEGDGLCKECFGILKTKQTGCLQRNRFQLDSVFSYAPYEGVLKNVLHEAKFQENRRLLSKVARAISSWMILETGDWDMIISVPLHSKRLAKRGFNQVDILFAHVMSPLPLNRDLVRTKYTRPLFDLNSEERKKELDRKSVV